MIRRALLGVGLFVTGRPRGAASLVAILTLGAALLLPRFRIEADVATLLPSDHESLALRRLTAGGATSERDLLLIVKGSNLAAALPAIERTLRASPLLTEVAAKRSELASARSERWRKAPLYFVPDDTLQEFERRLAGSQRRAVLEELATTIAEDPLLGTRLAREDPLQLRWVFDAAQRHPLAARLDRATDYMVLRGGERAFVRVRGRGKPSDIRFSQAILADLERGLHDYQVDIVGSYRIARDDEKRLRGDLTWSALWSVTLVSLFLVVSLRSLTEPLVLVTPVALSILWALSYGGAILGPLAPVSAASAAVLAGLGVDFGIHYLGRYRVARARRSHRRAVLETFARTGMPLLAGMATTVAAFLALVFSAFRGLASFGILAALGLVFAMAATLLLLPLLLRRRRPGQRASPVVALACRAIRSPARWPILVALGAFAITGWVLAGFSGLQFDADLKRLRPDDDPMIAAASDLEAALGFAPLPVTLLVASELPVAECARRLARLAHDGVIAFSDGPHRDRPAAGRRRAIRQLRQRASEWLPRTNRDLEELGFEPAAFAAAFASYQKILSAEPEPVEPVLLRWHGRTFRTYHLYPRTTPWERRSRAALRTAVEHAFAGTETRLVLALGAADELTPLLAGDLVRLAGISAAAVIALVLLSAGSLWSGFLAMLPMLTGLGVTLGALALFDLPLHLGNFVAIPLVLGIGIDDGIHMVHRVREERAGTADVRPDHALQTTGHSIWRTSATTSLAFGSLALATSPGLASLGVLLVLGVTACFVTSILLLPLLPFR